MDKKNNIYEPSSIDIANILNVFKKRKWWFAGSFIVLLCIGLLFSFLISRDYQYKASTIVTLQTGNLKYQQVISDYYPQDASKLWLISSERMGYYHYYNYLNVLLYEINSDEFLNKVIDKMDNEISTHRLKKRLFTEANAKENIFILNTFSSTQEGSKHINETILSTYISQKEGVFKEVYDELIYKVMQDILLVEKELDIVSVEAGEYFVDYKKDLVENLSTEDNGTIGLESSEFIPPDLQSRIIALIEKYKDLSGILDNLLNNEEFYITNHENISSTMVNKNLSHFRNILLSTAAALVFSLIFIYIVDFIILGKNKRNNLTGQ